ncbi:uncharacterized protein LAESUDRAFT_816677 [Laetiporus sulphureus 93-53]|uniref:Uncharacterized protein n=1 Tax=Laetiporus sulphureus 93-53 TaxID=1314785 RepID=A0A165B398_9APHY|nr:uncharacterized protein LAESUDRAFT_816677 [Laetiporus sulphureus 93-53]KZT00139.1 hypothetical protein LAESUDRAFT_816677 [Laetiporus sulphureus 93-53]
MVLGLRPPAAPPPPTQLSLLPLPSHRSCPLLPTLRHILTDRPYTYPLFSFSRASPGSTSALPSHSNGTNVPRRSTARSPLATPLITRSERENGKIHGGMSRRHRLRHPPPRPHRIHAIPNDTMPVTADSRRGAGGTQCAESIDTPPRAICYDDARAATCAAWYVDRRQGAITTVDGRRNTSQQTHPSTTVTTPPA